MTGTLSETTRNRAALSRRYRSRPPADATFAIVTAPRAARAPLRRQDGNPRSPHDPVADNGRTGPTTPQRPVPPAPSQAGGAISRSPARPGPRRRAGSIILAKILRGSRLDPSRRGQRPRPALHPGTAGGISRIAGAAATRPAPPDRPTNPAPEPGSLPCARPLRGARMGGRRGDARPGRPATHQPVPARPSCPRPACIPASPAHRAGRPYGSRPSGPADGPVTCRRHDARPRGSARPLSHDRHRTRLRDARDIRAPGPS
jgi:hypothetical protein